MSSTLISGGLFFDGTGAPGQPDTDVLVRDGAVAAVGPRGSVVAPEGAERVDAAGCWVLPGMIDLHTHYDAELALAPDLSESARHGVTTVVVGSCSIGFVASDAEDAADLFTRVEAIPREAVLPLLRQVKRWSDAAGWRAWLERNPTGVHVASFLGHSDIRAAAMGLLPAVDPRARPDAAALAAMERQVESALDAGFLGLSEMTNPWDKLDGDRAWSAPLPSVFAGWGERRALHRRLRERGAILQTAPNLVTRVNAVGMAVESGAWGGKRLRTTVITMMDLKADPWVRGLASTLAWLANRVLGGDLRWQALPVPFDLWYDGMDSVLFEEFPAGEAIRHLARDRGARARLLADPAWRARFRAEIHKRLSPRVWHRDLDDARIVDAPDPSLVGRTFAEVARSRGEDPVTTFLDLLLEHDTALRWHTCLANHRPDKVAEIIRDPNVLIGFSDAGAHIRNMAFYNAGLRMLRLVRDDARAGRPGLTLEAAVHRLTGEIGAWLGIDAGTLRVGGRADLVVVDPERLDDRVSTVALAPYPGVPGLERLVNGGTAARLVLVAGVPVARDGAPVEGRRVGRFLEARR